MKRVEPVRYTDPTTAEFVRRCDRNFEELAREDGPAQVTRDYVFRDNDQIDSLQVDATAGNITITLPNPTGRRRRRVIKTDLSANTVTVQGSATISGSPSYTIVAQYDLVEVEPTGLEWIIINSIP